MQIQLVGTQVHITDPRNILCPTILVPVKKLLNWHSLVQLLPVVIQSHKEIIVLLVTTGSWAVEEMNQRSSISPSYHLSSAFLSPLRAIQQSVFGVHPSQMVSSDQANATSNHKYFIRLACHFKVFICKKLATIFSSITCMCNFWIIF